MQTSFLMLLFLLIFFIADLAAVEECSEELDLSIRIVGWPSQSYRR